MKFITRTVLIIAIFGAALTPPATALEIVATTSDLGAIAEEIGGDHLSVTNLARGTEDPHFVTPRPSYIRLLNRADLLIEGGAELEQGWLPPLVQSARNREIHRGNNGYLDASEGVRMLNVPAARVDRSRGDVHTAGNPHYLLDPENGLVVAESIATRLAELDPDNAEDYRNNLDRFRDRLEEKLETWSTTLEPYRGTKVVTYHATFNYFAERFGFEIVDTVEPLPGIEPSPRHITALVSRIRNEDIAMIWMEPFRPRRTAQRVAEQSGVPLLALPDKPGATEGADDYLAVFDVMVDEIVNALEGS